MLFHCAAHMGFCMARYAHCDALMQVSADKGLTQILSG